MHERQGTRGRRLAGWTGLAACAVLLAPAAAANDEADHTNRVSFHVERSREVANDWLQATLAITVEDPDPAALANRINEAMSWALGVARDAKAVESRTGGYNTYPVHEQGRIRRWRGSQQLVLESGDFDAVTELVGKLQSRLQLQGLSFSVSPERRRAVSDELIAETLAAYKARAEIIRMNLGSRAYQLVRLDLATGGGAPPRPEYRAEMVRMAADAVAPPAVEGGTSRVQVSASATIELE